MADLISRQDAIDEINKLEYPSSLVDVKRIIVNLPSAQHKVGKWIKLDMHAHLADHKCTACGQECYVPTCMGEPMYSYCPNCGADMRGDEE